MWAVLEQIAAHATAGQLSTLLQMIVENQLRSPLQFYVHTSDLRTHLYPESPDDVANAVHDPADFQAVRSAVNKLEKIIYPKPGKKPDPATRAPRK